MNQITSDAKVISQLLHNRYIVQYYQREYSWETKQIQELIDDLTNAFYENYEEEHSQREVRDYDGYFLGPIILTSDGAIIDGQQRLSSITLLLIYLNHLQSEYDQKVNVDHLIFSEKFGEKTFSINVPERDACLDALYRDNEYEIHSSDSESVINLTQRYKDIETFFPQDMDQNSLLVFIEWLIEKVVFVQIVTSTEQDAHRVFVAMNDRGLRLTPVEMLKGYLLSEITDNTIRNNMNDIWKKNVLNLKEIEKDGDADFIRNWLRAQYAETQRDRRKGAKNLDYETIGETPHKWVRENSTKLGLKNSLDFETFISDNFVKYAKVYMNLKKYATEFHDEFSHVYYNAHRIFTLQYQLILAAIAPEDDQLTINKKIKIVSRFIDQFIARRVFNFRSMNYSTVLYTVFNLTVEIRQKPINELITIVKNHLEQMRLELDAIDNFYMNQYTKRFIFHNLARMTQYIEEQVGLNTRFEDYVDRARSNSYDIEHILPNDILAMDDQEEFSSLDEFNRYRDSFGGLVLLPKDKNRSLQAMPYKEKVKKYDSENLLARTLHDNCYHNNPLFLRFIQEKELEFKPYETFGKKEINERQALYKEICKQIWNADNIDKDL